MSKSTENTENKESETALTVEVIDPKSAPPALLKPIATPDELIEVHKLGTELVTKALEKGRDYGLIPGTNKPTLLKPGAERICTAFGSVAEYEIIGKEIDHDRQVAYQSKVYNQGRPTGEMEWRKSLGLYRYVIKCTLRGRDGLVHGQAVGSCSTLEAKYVSRPRDCENTVLKMAQKRALVGATVNAYGLSDRFTQDVEDYPNQYGSASTTKTNKRAS